MLFAIQVGNPRVLGAVVPGQVADLAGAVEAIYAPRTEDAFLFWNRVPVRISYRYDLSVLVDDLVPLIEQIVGSHRESAEVRWASNTFSAIWQIDWESDQIHISAQWRSVAGSYEELLNSRPSVALSCQGFLGEWRPLLDRVSKDVAASKISCEDSGLLNRLNELILRLPEQSSFYGDG